MNSQIATIAKAETQMHVAEISMTVVAINESAKCTYDLCGSNSNKVISPTVITKRIS